MSFVLRYTALSDRGLVRGNNEDAAYAGSRLLSLSDGMGGHEAGEVASSLVINAMIHLDDEDPGAEILSKMENAVRSGNIAIAEHVAENPSRDGMGTTLTALLFTGTSMGLAHVGDSRAYLLREGSLTQITRDDTYVQSLIDEGRITVEEAHSHPQRSLILKALTGHEVQPTLNIREALKGDRYLLCSDGLSDVVSASTIETVLGDGDVEAVADKLVELALRSGGPDNITVVVAEVTDSEFAQSPPIIAGSALGEDQQHAPPPDSAAGRAAALKQQRTPVKVSAAEEPTEAQTPTPRSWRLPVAILALVVVCIAAAYGVRALLHTNYYLGAHKNSVVVYRGISGSLLGIQLQSRYGQVCLRESSPPLSPVRTEFVAHQSSSAGCVPLHLDDLETATRSWVTNLPSGNKNDVLEQVQTLSQHLLPQCSAQPQPPEPQKILPPSVAGPSSEPAKPSPTRSTPPTPSSSSTPHALPTVNTPSAGPPPSFPSIDPNIALSGPTPIPVQTWKPGIDCRVQHE